MALFMPDLMLNSVLEVTPEILEKLNVKGLVLDVDNTLTTHSHPEPEIGVREWISKMNSHNIPMMIVSNNTQTRVRPFADLLGLPFVSMSFKPATRGVTKACKKFGLSANEVAIVGDQIFTDVIAGNLKGLKTILVTPFEYETFILFRAKRRVEKIFINKYNKKGVGKD